jgi:DNA repair protein RecO (recombination protein O)
MKKTDQAILLHRLTYSESSLILTFYTSQNGLQKFIFQGGKKKAHQLFPLSLSEITYYKRPDSDLGKLVAVESHRLLSNILFDPIKSSLAFFLAEILQKCLKTEEEEAPLFQFLETEILSVEQGTDLKNFPITFLLQFSHYLGIYPHQTGNDPRFFDAVEGCMLSFEPQRGAIYYEGEAVALLVQLMHSSVPNENGFLHTKQNRQKALEILVHYYQLHIPQFNELKSLDIIREILYT